MQYLVKLLHQQTSIICPTKKTAGVNTAKLFSAISTKNCQIIKSMQFLEVLNDVDFLLLNQLQVQLKIYYVNRFFQHYCKKAFWVSVRKFPETRLSKSGEFFSTFDSVVFVVTRYHFWLTRLDRVMRVAGMAMRRSTDGVCLCLSVFLRVPHPLSKNDRPQTFLWSAHAMQSLECKRYLKLRRWNWAQSWLQKVLKIVQMRLFCIENFKLIRPKAKSI